MGQTLTENRARDDPISAAPLRAAPSLGLLALPESRTTYRAASKQEVSWGTSCPSLSASGLRAKRVGKCSALCSVLAPEESFRADQPMTTRRQREAQVHLLLKIFIIRTEPQQLTGHVTNHMLASLFC